MVSVRVVPPADIAVGLTHWYRRNGKLLNSVRQISVLSPLLCVLGYSWVACLDGGQNVGGGSGSQSGKFIVEQKPKFGSTSYGSTVIRGQVRNNTDKFLSYAQVSCQIYDGGVQIASALDNTSGVSASASWRYEALLIEDLLTGSYGIECQADGW